MRTFQMDLKNCSFSKIVTTRSARMKSWLKHLFSSDDIQNKVIVDDLETREDIKKLLLEAKIEIRKDIIYVTVVYNDDFPRFLEPFCMNISTEFEFSIPSISCLLSSLGSIGASAIHCTSTICLSKVPLLGTACIKRSYSISVGFE